MSMFTQTFKALQDLPACLQAQYRVVHTCPYVKDYLVNLVYGKGKPPFAVFDVTVFQLLSFAASLVFMVTTFTAMHIRTHLKQRSEVNVLRERNKTLEIRNEYLEAENKALTERLEEKSTKSVPVPKTTRRKKNMWDTDSILSTS